MRASRGGGQIKSISTRTITPSDIALPNEYLLEPFPSGVTFPTGVSVAGIDNAEFRWLLRSKDFHDIPCKDIILKGQNYTSSNPLPKDSTSLVTTGAYSAFHTSFIFFLIITAPPEFSPFPLRTPLPS